ncbi:four helix bundle protein [Sulfidibacter corallicola]|uniref:Four helix bundle protein n=1 Tax=Sulfidibacter corallicola TaxID=2818388 RepID=A0A8A4TMY5_SULCO|nr:four helix bundle protein [Sulfidibacter corallicola]QTD50913.1 four helix bundle protein [Sulfidibacter corallicola]
MTYHGELVAQKLGQSSAALLEAITLALKGFDRQENVVEADRALALVRLYLRLALEKQMIDDRQYAYGCRQCDSLGRQLGGWLKSLQAV